MNIVLSIFSLMFFVSIGAWKYANLILIDGLKHFYSSAHLEAGEPDFSFIADNGKFNKRWAAHILFFGFLDSRLTPSTLRFPFWVAWLSGWYIVLSIIFLCAMWLTNQLG
jgi:hypothetical protein